MSYRRRSRQAKEESPAGADDPPSEAKRRRLGEEEGEGKSTTRTEDSPAEAKRSRLDDGDGEGARKDETAAVAPPEAKRSRLSEGDKASTEEGGGSVRELESSHKTQIRIAEAPESGEYVRLANESGEDLRVGYWLLKATNGEKEVFFKFHSKTDIPANSTFTVYGKSSAEKTPCSVVMKKKWPKGAETKVYLYNEKKMLVASLTPKIKEKNTVASTRFY